MCLIIDETRTKNFWKTLRRKNKSFIWAYKVYIYDSEHNGFYSCSFPTSGITYGEIVSNRSIQKAGQDCVDFTQKFTYNNGDSGQKYMYINRGIHVILSSLESRKRLNIEKDWRACSKHQHVVLVRVKCYKKDFVGCGSSEVSDAVFMKVHIIREEYRRIKRKIVQERRKKQKSGS